MATASSVIGSLAVNITASTAPFEKGMQRAQKLIKNFASGASLIGGGVTAAITGMLRSFDSVGSELHDLSTATGISVEQLSFLKYAAEQSSTSLEAITKAARELQSKGIDPNKFESIVASIAAIEDPTLRAQRAFAIFGKKAGFPILKLIKDVPELKKRFMQLGGGFTTKMAEQADKLGDAWGDVKLAMSNVSQHIAFALAPKLTRLSNYIAENGRAITKWVDDHGDFVLGIGAVAGAMTLAALAFYTFTKLTWGLVAACTALTTNPTVLTIVAIGVCAGLAANNIRKASDETLTWGKRIAALISLVSPLAGIFADAGVRAAEDSGGDSTSKISKSASVMSMLTGGRTVGATPSTPTAAPSEGGRDRSDTALLIQFMKAFLEKQGEGNKHLSTIANGEKVQVAGVR